ncbi:MAG: dihydropyrimidinase [Lachnospiraceae bacterium]|nr:dihydropyrimidinase [Lachnospiraceae bacterium]
MEILIKNGKIVNAGGSFKGDVLVRNGRIAAVGKGLDTKTASKTIDASGLYVLPGAIDVHTHLEMPMMGKTFSADGYESGTRAAACGGTTTVFDYTLQENGKPMLEEIADRNRLAEPAACVDYAFHGGISEVNEARLNEVAEMAKQGFPSIKAYMTYAFGLDDKALFELLQRAAKERVLITVHAESHGIVEANRAEFKKEGLGDVWYHYLSRPEIAEEEADIRAVTLARAAGAPIYIVHLGNEAGERYIAKARAEGIPVYAETCPHYLAFTNEVFKRPDGIRFICSPPMKGKESQIALWEGVSRGVIDVIATDHCPAQTFEKDWGKDDYTLAPCGVMGVENMYPYMLNAANKGMISFERAVELCSYNPSRIFGCDTKGAVLPGLDADIVLYDPGKEFTITVDKMHSNIDYTIYEGMKLKGYPVLTMSRGSVVYEDGEFRGEPGYGRLLRRRISCAYEKY